MAADLKLTYFDIYGLGELIRLELAYAGKQYVDNRVTKDQWQTLKPNTKPLGQMPLLEMNGETYPQSFAICNYLAKEFGLYPKTSLDQMISDIVLSSLHDLVRIQGKWLYLDEGAEKSKLKAEAPALAQKHLAYLESLLAKNKTGYFIGASLTLADLALLDILTGYPRHSLNFHPDTYPNIAKNKQLVLQNKNIAAYVASRPDCPF